MGKKKNKNKTRGPESIVQSQFLATEKVTVSSSAMIQKNLRSPSSSNTLIISKEFEKECYSAITVLKNLKISPPQIKDDLLKILEEKRQAIWNDIKLNPFHEAILTHSKIKPTDDPLLMDLLIQLCEFSLIVSQMEDFSTAEQYLDYAQQGAIFLKDKKCQTIIESLVNLRKAQIKNLDLDFEASIGFGNKSLQFYAKYFKEIYETKEKQRRKASQLKIYLEENYVKFSTQLNETNVTRYSMYLPRYYEEISSSFYALLESQYEQDFNKGMDELFSKIKTHLELHEQHLECRQQARLVQHLEAALKQKELGGIAVNEMQGLLFLWADYLNSHEQDGHCQSESRLQQFKNYLEQFKDSDNVDMLNFLILEAEFLDLTEEISTCSAEVDNANYGIMLIHLNMAIAYSRRFLVANEKVNPLYNVQKISAHVQWVIDINRLKKERLLSPLERFIIVRMLVELINSIIPAVEKLISMIVAQDDSLQQNRVHLNFIDQLLITAEKCLYVLNQLEDYTNTGAVLKHLQEKLFEIRWLLELKITQTTKSGEDWLGILEKEATVSVGQSSEKDSLDNNNSSDQKDFQARLSNLVFEVKDDRLPEDVYLKGVSLLKKKNYCGAVEQFRELERLIEQQHEYLYLQVKLNIMLAKCYHEFASGYVAKVNFHNIFKEKRPFNEDEILSVNQAYEYYQYAVNCGVIAFNFCENNAQHLHRYYDELWLHGQNVSDQINIDLNAFRSEQIGYLKKLKAIKQSMIKHHSEKWYKPGKFDPQTISETSRTTRWCAESYRVTDTIRINAARISEGFRKKVSSKFTEIPKTMVNPSVGQKVVKSKKKNCSMVPSSNKNHQITHSNDSTESLMEQVQAHEEPIEMMLWPDCGYFYDQFGWLYYGNPTYHMPVIYDDTFYYNAFCGHVPLESCERVTLECLSYFNQYQTNPEGFVDQQRVEPMCLNLTALQGRFFSSLQQSTIAIEEGVSVLKLSNNQPEF